MRLSHSTALIFALGANALPKPNPVVSYNVVDVGGPTTSAAAAPGTLVETITKSSSPKTVTESAAPSTVTEAPVTITISPTSEATATTTERWTVTIANTELPSFSYQPTSSAPTFSYQPSSSSSSSGTTWVVAATDTVTMDQWVPPPASYSTLSSSASSTLRPAFPTTFAMWNSTTSDCNVPTAANTAYSSALPTGYPHFVYSPEK